MIWKSLLTGGCVLLNVLMHYFRAAISNHLSEKPKIWSLKTGLTVFHMSVFSSPEPKDTHGPVSVRRRCRPQCSKIFFSKTAGPIKAKFYVELPWVGGTIFCSRHLGHMTKTTPIYGKKPFKNPFQNQRADFHVTWYVASGTPAHHNLFK